MRYLEQQLSSVDVIPLRPAGVLSHTKFAALPLSCRVACPTRAMTSQMLNFDVEGLIREVGHMPAQHKLVPNLKFSEV